MARARSFGNIRKVPSGRYQARYWNLGKQIPADTSSPARPTRGVGSPQSRRTCSRGVWIDPNAGKVPFGEYATRWVAERPVRPLKREIYEGRRSIGTRGNCGRRARRPRAEQVILDDKPGVRWARTQFGVMHQETQQ